MKDEETMHTDDLGQWRLNNVPVYNKNKMKLGVFATNCSNGTTMTHAPTTFEPTYKHNVKIAKLADTLGFELLVPVGRWKHFGGSTQFNGDNMEVYTWATAMACNTSNIMVCATSHTPIAHPLFAAKQGSSIDNISEGRFALNIVCGWFRPEIEMFGKEQLPHSERYAMAHEWVTCVKKAWSEQNFSFQGKYFSIKEGFLSPKPIQKPGPILLNAGNSEDGREFSAREMDFNFITMATPEEAGNLVKDIHRRAALYKRQCGVMSQAFVCCRETESEARAAYNNILEQGDWDAARNVMELLGVESGSFDATIKKFAERFVAGWGGYPLVGTPEQVVDKMKELSDLGVEGLILSWLDYHEELEFFGDRVLPLMEQAGLRLPKIG
jgi:FMNH2-dependent dimethyl sulfone monooxygenase